MDPENSPFTPNQPVNAEFFTGRQEQIVQLLSMVRKAKRRRLQIGWISGERGIGKSSLAAMVGTLAERKEGALSAHLHLGGARELKHLVQATYLQLLKDNQSKSWGERLRTVFADRVESVGLFGINIKLKLEEEDFAEAIHNFPEVLSSLLERAGGDREVLLLILDDINGLADNREFADWLKSMVDAAAIRGTVAPVCLIFVGLEDRFRRMKVHNPSVARVFHPLIDMAPWTQSESKAFFRSAFEKVGCRIGDDDIALLANCSDGLPVMAHQIGQSVLEVAENGEVSRGDILQGVFHAAESIGRRFLNKEVIQALRSEKYRSILRKIADVPMSRIEWEFSRKQLHSLPTLTSEEKKGLDNFVHRMGKLGAIVPSPGGQRGVYRFATSIHRIYFMLEAGRTKRG